MSAEDYETTFAEFWEDIVGLPGGIIDVEQVKRELHDYKMLLDSVPLVYSHVTGNRISKPNTHPDAVIAEADEHYERLCAEDREEV